MIHGIVGPTLVPRVGKDSEKLKQCTEGSSEERSCSAEQRRKAAEEVMLHGPQKVTLGT